MQLLFKQRLFSWFDSYDIYNELGQTVYTVQGKLAWGHKLEIYDASGTPVGLVEEKIFTFLPRFIFYRNGNYLGQVQKELTFFKPLFTLDYGDWQVEGDWLQWNYTITDRGGQPVANLSKEIFKLTDTYVLDIPNPDNALVVLMIVLAIDAVKCSQNS